MKKVTINLLGSTLTGHLTVHDVPPPNIVYVGASAPFMVFEGQWNDKYGVPHDNDDAEVELDYTFTGYTRRLPMTPLTDEEHDHYMRVTEEGVSCAMWGTLVLTGKLAYVAELHKSVGNFQPNRLTMHSITLVDHNHVAAVYTGRLNHLGPLIGLLESPQTEVRWFARMGDDKYYEVSYSNSVLGLAELHRAVDWRNAWLATRADGAQACIIQLPYEALPGDAIAESKLLADEVAE